MAINWLKIMGNGGVAFFTTLSGIKWAGIPVDDWTLFKASLFPALIAAGLSICKELSIQGNGGIINLANNIRTKKGQSNICSILHNATLF